jgi:hypothetical protein
MALSHAQLAVVVVLLIAVAPSRAEQIAPVAPPAQLQQTVPARPEPAVPSGEGGRSVLPQAQFKAPVAPGLAPQQPAPVTQQSAPAMALTPARP